LLAWLPEELSWSQVGATAAGAVGGLLVFVLLWLLGAFPSGSVPTSDSGPRLAAIENQLRDLAARPAPPSVDPKSIEGIGTRIDGVAARLGRLESAQAAPRAPVTDPVVLSRLNAAESSVRSMADSVKALADNVTALSLRTENVAALSGRSDDVDAALRDIRSRLDKLAAAVTDIQTNARAAAAGSDQAVRLAVAAGALRVAVERGDTFVAELAVARPLTADAKVLLPLEQFAASGIPSDAALAKELSVLLRPMLRAAGEPPRDGGFLERLQANAEKLVRIRPIDEAPGDDRSAILARVERRAAQGNVAGALTELTKLPPAARAPIQPWIAKAEARNKAMEASRRFAADAIAALKATP
jgi:hypothetical protein